MNQENYYYDYLDERAAVKRMHAIAWNTRDWVEALVEAVYQTGDVERLEHCLQELCFEYMVHFDRDLEPKVKTNESVSN